MMADDIQRDIGRLEAQVANVTTDVSEIRKDIKAILATLSEQKGSWRTIVWISGASASFGALVVKLFPWFSTFPK